jgi:DNA modification methylase
MRHPKTGHHRMPLLTITAAATQLATSRRTVEREFAWSSQQLAARVLTLPRGEALQDGKEHPTQKPVRLMAWCLDMHPKAKTVCDPFMGTGTTGVACVQSGRRFIGIERERRYFDVACERMERAQAQGQLLPPAEKPAAVQEVLL